MTPRRVEITFEIESAYDRQVVILQFARRAQCSDDMLDDMKNAQTAERQMLSGK
jgi:hypothetical protein